MVARQALGHVDATMMDIICILSNTGNCRKHEFELRLQNFP